MQFKLKLLSIFLFLSIISLAQKTHVSFTVTFIKPYCGGARPSPEIQEMARTPQAYAEKKIVLVNAKGKCIKLTTNMDGVVNCTLKVGEYKLYEEWRIKKKTPDNSSKKRYDTECLKAEWKKEFATLNVTSEKFDYNSTNGIFVPCEWAIPCMLDALRPQPSE